METERQRLIRTGMITPFAGVQGTEKQRLRDQEIPPPSRSRHSQPTSDSKGLDFFGGSEKRSRPDGGSATGSGKKKKKSRRTMEKEAAAVQAGKKLKKNKRNRLADECVDDGDIDSFRLRVLNEVRVSHSHSYHKHA